MKSPMLLLLVATLGRGILGPELRPDPCVRIVAAVLGLLETNPLIRGHLQKARPRRPGAIGPGPRSRRLAVLR